jgi:hypothetical protein
MIRFLSASFLVLSLALGLSACGEDKKETKTAPTSTTVKKVETEAPKTVEKTPQDMTPAEALDNMKRDAGTVADKTVEGYNAAKEAVTKALEK